MRREKKAREAREALLKEMRETGELSDREQPAKSSNAMKFSELLCGSEVINDISEWDLICEDRPYTPFSEYEDDRTVQDNNDEVPDLDKSGNCFLKVKDNKVFDNSFAFESNLMTYPVAFNIPIHKSDICQELPKTFTVYDSNEAPNQSVLDNDSSCDEQDLMRWSENARIKKSDGYSIIDSFKKNAAEKENFESLSTKSSVEFSEPIPLFMSRTAKEKYTQLDSTSLHCKSGENGLKLKSQPQEQGENNYYIPVNDSKSLVNGNDSILCLKIKTGQELDRVHPQISSRSMGNNISKSSNNEQQIQSINYIPEDATNKRIDRIMDFFKEC